MRNIYTVSFFEQTIASASGDYDFFEIDPAADKPIEIVAIYLANKSEVKDAEEEMVSWSLWYASGGTFTSGNGTSTTPAKLDPFAPTASFAAETVGSTPATTTGTLTQIHQDTFNIRVGLAFVFPPEMRLECDGQANSACGVRLRTALGDDATMSGTLYVKEL